MNINGKMNALISAFNEARLCAMHIDMQWHFMESACREGRLPTEKVIPPLRQFSSDLREHNIPNHWVAYTNGWGVSDYNTFKTGQAVAGRLPLIRPLKMVPDLAKDHEMVFEKAKQWAFKPSNSILADYLRENGQDVIIIDGVKDKYCVTNTISSGLREGFRFYVALDTTNCPMQEFYEFERWFQKGSTAEQKERVTFTTTIEILSTLNAVRDAPQTMAV